jgi:hypothetical protein
MKNPAKAKAKDPVQVKAKDPAQAKVKCHNLASQKNSQQPKSGQPMIYKNFSKRWPQEKTNPSTGKGTCAASKPTASSNCKPSRTWPQAYPSSKN